MASTTSVKQHAPSPALSLDGGLDEGFQQLQSFNKAVGAREEIQYYPNPPGYYGNSANYDHRLVGLGVHTGEYPHPLEYESQVTQHDRYPQIYSTPPLTSSTEHLYDGIRTRSGRSLGSPTDLKRLPSGRTRNSRSPRVKKPKLGKPEKPNYPELEMVLSELAKTYPDTEVEDMEAYVRRAPAERQRRAQEKKRATPPRPMNSFMLYRHCYAETIKKFLAGKGNHQQVSAIAGKSWGIEPENLRLKFQEYADLEKESHKKAFPDYHFKPKKDPKQNKRRKGKDDDELSDLDDMESWGTPGPRDPKRVRKGEAQTGHREYYQPTFYDPRMAPQHMSFNRSAFEASNPGMVPLGAYPTSQPGQYFQRTAQPYGTSIEDVRYPQPELSHMYPGSGRAALPGSSSQALLYQTQPQQDEQQFLDPRLSEWPTVEDYDNARLRSGADPRYPQGTIYYDEPQYHHQSDSHGHPGEQTLIGPMDHWGLEGDGLGGGHDDLGYLDQ